MRKTKKKKEEFVHKEFSDFIEMMRSSMGEFQETISDLAKCLHNFDKLPDEHKDKVVLTGLLFRSAMKNFSVSSSRIMDGELLCMSPEETLIKELELTLASNKYENIGSVSLPES